MAFEKPPSLDDYREIMPEHPKEITPGQKRARILLIVLGIFVLGLAALNLMKNDFTSTLRGTGAVRGMVLDAQGSPFVGNIYIEKTTLNAKTNPDGRFELANIPAGNHLLVVADAVSGREFPVLVNAGQTTDLGIVQFKSTATP
jgi:hypothetical protein